MSLRLLRVFNGVYIVGVLFVVCGGTMDEKENRDSCLFKAHQNLMRVVQLFG